MKLKKSLLALTTAATVAVAGSTAAVAEDNGANGSKDTNISTSLGKQDGDTKTKEEKKQELAGSANKFFDWDENTSGLKKLTTVVTLITTVAALVGGIVSLFNNFQKLGKLAK
ncbi:hypothetical protein [Corynebacterium sp. ACRPH]|uniref:hypothetical protein n=1 Tax=Corynebacterium sp. ACRPH TaxID=2918199 RepID=UPI001EF20BC6|nr:hypothetical protein [Corynebacterium sp. ACRPH]MCG7455863.1 hypothetical protein [Corynebacterium sp. ACRPH]